MLTVTLYRKPTELTCSANLAKMIGVSNLTLTTFASANEVRVQEPTAYHEDLRDEMIEEMLSFGEYGWFPDSLGWDSY